MGEIQSSARRWTVRCALLLSGLFGILALTTAVAGATVAVGAHRAAPAAGNVNIIGNWPGAAMTPGGGDYPQVLVWSTETSSGAITGYETLIGSTAQTGTLAGTISGNKMTFKYTLGGYISNAVATVSDATPPMITGTFADNNGVTGTETFTEGGAAPAASTSTSGAPSTPATVSAPVVAPTIPSTPPGSGQNLGIDGLGALSHHDPARSTITSSLPSPRTAFSPLSSDVVNAIITIGAALLITFPAALFNATFQENYAEIRTATFRRLRALHLMGPEVVPGETDAPATPAAPVAEAPAPPLRPTPRARKRVAPAEVGAVGGALVVASAADPELPAVAVAEKRGLHPTRTFLIVLLAGALLGCFNDPNFGFTGHSVLTFIGVILSELVGMTIPALVAAAYHRGRHGSVPAGLHALPGGLAIALACVVLSRVVGFQPGYLYGIVVGVSFNRELPKNEKGHVIALSTAAVLVVSVAAWFLWEPINHAAAHHGAFIGTVLFDNLLGAMFVSGLVGSVLSMVPLQFMPGSTLRAWKQAVWASVFLVSLFLLIQVLLRPRGGHGGHAPLVTTLVLFGVFAVGSVAFHDYWARRGHATRGEPVPALAERLKDLWKTPRPVAADPA